MDTLLVVKVERYSPGDDCAEVTLQSGSGEVVAFCFPCDWKVGDRIPNHLNTLGGMARAAYLNDWPEEEKEALSIEQIERLGNYQYRGRGRVIDQESGLIEVCGFVIELDEVPFDEIVEFEIDRLDL